MRASTHSSTNPVGTTATPGIWSQFLTGLLVLAILVFPLWHGATRSVPFFWLGLFLQVLFGLWLLGIIARGEVGIWKQLPFGLATLLWAAAWIIYLVAPHFTLDAFTFNHIASQTARWPASMMSRDPLRVTLLVSGSLALVAVVADLARHPRLRSQLCHALAFSGALVVGVGFYHIVQNLTTIYGEAVPRMPSNPFGPFFHHTSAGAFINLTWPIALALVITAHRRWIAARRKLPGWDFVVGLILLACIVAGHLGHVSRLPQVLAILAFPTVMYIYHRSWEVKRLTPKRRLLAVALCLGAVFLCGLLIFQANRFDGIKARWSMFLAPQDTMSAPYDPPPPEIWSKLMRDDLFVAYSHRQFWWGDRGLSFSTSLRAIGERPLLGYGPGGWPEALINHTDHPYLRTFYLHLQFAHQDFFQTAVEFGLPFALGCALLIGIALYRVIRTGFDYSRFRDICTAGAATALVLVLLQGLIDFPLQIPVNQFSAAILLGLCWSGVQPISKPTLPAASGQPDPRPLG